MKTWSSLTHWLLVLVVMAWLGFALAWGALHWLIVPRIGEFRQQLETRATQALGITVRLGAITAQSNGLVPSFELTDVTLLDKQDRVALSLPRILIALSPRSLWRFGFEQIYIDQPKLDVRRAIDGKITIGGLDFSNPNPAETDAIDWFFSQLEFAIHEGTVRWSDEQRGAAPVVLQKVAVVVRNRGRHHDLRIDATPPQAWGQSFSLRGKFLQPLLAHQKGQWRDWDGQFYASFEQADLSELRRYADLGVDLRQGRGALRTWLEVRHGRVTQALADVALSKVNVVLATDLQPLALQHVQGRLGGRLLDTGFEFASESLTFDTDDGLHWPGGNVFLAYAHAQGPTPEHGEVKADRLDLAALAQIASRLPLEPSLREQLLSFNPTGWVEVLQASWQGPARAPEKYVAKGKLSQFSLAAVGSIPGIAAINVDFDFDQQAGKASLTSSGGGVVLPDWLQDPVIKLDQLAADVRWQRQGERISAQFSRVTFANDDAQGEAQIKWETSDPAKSATHSRFPGVLDVQASLSRATGKQVHRYLPLVIDKSARDYVRDAVQDGKATAVRFQIKGDIDQMPNIDPKKGTFKITAQFEDAKLAYVPRSLQASADLPWPPLSDLSGELVIDRLQLQVRNVKAKLGESGALQVTHVDAQIADLNRVQVSVNADLKGSLPELLSLVNDSPLRAMTGQALASSVATGSADYKFKLMLPLADMTKTTLKGSVVLGGNDLHISPDTPKLARARGIVNFTDAGFALNGVQAKMLGGDVRLEGGLVLSPDSPSGRGLPTLIHASGVATAEGLSQATELGFVARLAHKATGSAAYSASLGLRKGVPELMVNSNLLGVALQLPQPLTKSAETMMPMRFETTLLNHASGPVQDRLSLGIANLVQVVYERDVSQAAPKVLRGAIAVGLDVQESAPMPARGVSANINLKNLNADAWSDALSQAAGVPMTDDMPGSSVAASYLPTVLAVRSEVLTFGGRQFNRVVIGASREDLLWKANLDATELNGYIEYRQPSNTAVAIGSGRVYARLARLTIAPSVASDVEALLDAQPASIPALDIVVDDFELRGKRLGRLEVEAINRGNSAPVREPGVREWRLNKFNMLMPEATLAATGNWAATSSPTATLASPGVAKVAERRRTLMNFKLDISDSGALLGRMGMKDLVRNGRGKLEGKVSWLGSPLSVDYPSLGGAFTVNVETGQFLKAEPGIAKLLGVLSLQSLPRRLTLDFRDVFSDGFAFDFLRGDVTIDKGIALTNNLQMQGVNAAIMMEGRADIANETQDIKVVVIPEINAGTASLLASVVNPVVGLGTFLAQVFLRRPLMESATQEFHVDGSWADPKITQVKRSAPTGSVAKPKESP